MPGSYLGLVNYADADTVRAWQEQSTEFVIIDVRTVDEFREDGHAPGAVIRSYYRGEKRAENINFLRAITSRFDAGQRLLLLCASGTRATQAAWELGEKQGFSDVYVFPGGYEGADKKGYMRGDGWKAAGLPVIFPLGEPDERENPNQ